MRHRPASGGVSESGLNISEEGQALDRIFEGGILRQGIDGVTREFFRSPVDHGSLPRLAIVQSIVV